MEMRYRYGKIVVGVIVICYSVLTDGVLASAGDGGGVAAVQGKAIKDTVGVSLSDTLRLGEVAVTARKIWVENGKVTMLPSKRAKNLARSMSALIDIMHTGILMADEGEIKTASGQKASLFINGEPVDKIDADTFWAKNVLRVEYMQSSPEPKYAGKSNIVNFVMREYIIGGLTRFDGEQEFPNSGDYSVSSKLVIGNTTVNAVVRGGYSKDYLSGSRLNETYDGIWYGGTEYSRITRTEEASPKQKNSNLNVGINARYKKSRFTATHGVSIGAVSNNSYRTIGSVGYNPDVIGGNSMYSAMTSKSPSGEVSGMYRYFLNDKWMMSGSWQASYARNSRFSNFCESHASEILTDVKEDVWSGKAQLLAGYQIASRMNLVFSVAETLTDYKTYYSGSTASSQNQRMACTDINVQWGWEVDQHFSMALRPQLSIHSRTVNNAVARTDWLSGITLLGTCSIDSRNIIDADLRYSLRYPSASVINDLILRQTELKWIEGNPSVRPGSHYSASVSYSWMPVNWFSHTLMCRAIVDNNESVLSYRSGGAAYDGVIGQYVNGLTCRSYAIYYAPRLNLFDGNLSVSPSIEYASYHVRAVNSTGKFRPKIYTSLFIGDWELSASCSGPEKFLNNAGKEVVNTDWQYDFGASYGNGNLIVDLSLNNIFNRYLYSDISMSDHAYGFVSRNWQKGRSVTLSVTYTFDYGKKTDRGIDINLGSGAATSILGAY